jgi:hypothetical protein
MGARLGVSVSGPPRQSRRLLVSLAIASVAGTYWYYAAWANPGGGSDFDQLWAGARALLGGENPYEVVRLGAPGPAGPFRFDLYYPLPALLAVLPLAWLPIVAARAVFCAFSFGILSYLLTRHAWYPLAGLASGAGLMTLTLAQGSALTAAAVLAPALGVLAAAKPNTHIAVVASYQRMRPVALGLGSGAVLFAIAFAVRPGWVADWLGAIEGAPTLRPIAFQPVGWLLLLAALRWRRSAARWVLATCLLPGTAVVYSALPLFAFRWSFRTTLVLALLSHAAMWPPLLLVPSSASFLSYVGVSTPSLVLLLYVPAVLFLLREPNELGAVDADAASGAGRPPAPPHVVAVDAARKHALGEARS